MGKDDNKKIGGVSGTRGTRGVIGTENIGEVEKVKKTGTVGGIGKAGAATGRRDTRTMSITEREELFKMINEEADKMFEKSQLSEEHREAVRNAVKMAVDAGLIEDDSEE